MKRKMDIRRYYLRTTIGGIRIVNYKYYLQLILADPELNEKAQSSSIEYDMKNKATKKKSYEGGTMIPQ